MNRKNKLLITLLIAVILFSVFAVKAYVSEEAVRYRSLGRRDPFVPLVGSLGSGLRGGAQNILTIEDATLEGILVGPKGEYNVIINGEIMAAGDQAGLLKVEEISKNSVKVTIEGTEYELKLYE